MAKEHDSHAAGSSGSHSATLDDTYGSGGRLCLDFTNTTGGRTTDSPSERLHTYADLLAWAEQEGVTPAAAASALRAWAQAEPGAAAAVLTRAVTLREAIYRTFSAHAAERAPADDDLALINRELGQALVHLRVAAVDGRFAWQWDDAVQPDHMLWPVARSAAELLVSGDLGRVRECASETCTWLFIDRSKNRSRRWCDMQECGNVAKVRRYRKRKQAGEEDAAI